VSPRLDDDLDVVPQEDQESHESIKCEPGKPAAGQRGNLWLVHSQQGCGLCLRQLSPSDRFADLVRQIGPGQSLLGVGDAKITDVVGALWGPEHPVPHEHIQLEIALTPPK